MDGAYTPTQFEDVTERKPLHEIFTFIDKAKNDKDKYKYKVLGARNIRYFIVTGGRGSGKSFFSKYSYNSFSFR